MSGTFKELRVQKLKEETAELEKAWQEGSNDPTQSPKANDEGSLSKEAEGIAGQEEATRSNNEPQTETKDLAYWRKEAGDYKQRFSVSKAKYDDNIRKLKDENLLLQQDRVELKKELNQLRQSVAANTPSKIDQAFNKETEDVLGSNTADAIKQTLKDQQALIDSLKSDLANAQLEKESKNIQDQRVSEYNSFLGDLIKLVPDYEAMNADEKFLDWLDAPNSIGKIRFDLLRKAEASRDVERVAQFFMDYKAQKSTKTQDSINKRMVPEGKGSEDIPDSDPNKKLWKKSEIDEFYRQVTKGEWKGRYKERKLKEDEIDQAYLSGRIVEG